MRQCRADAAWAPDGLGALPGPQTGWARCLSAGRAGRAAWAPDGLGALPGPRTGWARCLGAGRAGRAAWAGANGPETPRLSKKLVSTNQLLTETPGSRGVATTLP
jgi:hypothetical protein